MEEIRKDPLVPAVKPDPRTSSIGEGPNRRHENDEGGSGGLEIGAPDLDKDLLCPICMQVIKDAFLTACGHSFCYMCIITHLKNKSDCPSVEENFSSACVENGIAFGSVSGRITTGRQGCDVSIKEVDNLLTLLAEKKRKMEQEEAERNMQILLDFLHCLRKQKVDELNEVQTDLQYIKEDINAVERHRIDLYRARDRYSVKLRMLGDDPSTRNAWPPEKSHTGFNSNSLSIRGGNPPANFQNKKFSDLQECYLQKRRQLVDQPHSNQESDNSVVRREGYSYGLADFQSVLTTFTRYSRLRVIAEIRHGDIFHSANIVSSKGQIIFLAPVAPLSCSLYDIEFDRDDELFATAGVSRCIKVFDFSSVVNEPADIQCPIVEMSTRSKLSCLSWNKHEKNHIASSDYEGIVTVWDVTTRQSLMEYEEHEKRAWSVDFSRTEPSMLVSGSDDCKEASVLNIDMKANICCVKYNPGSSNFIAVGSADHHIHYYDLRNISQPLHVFSGHKKAVSYVKFLSNNELASASTDSTLRLWDVKDNLPEITKPVTSHRFGSLDMEEAEEEAGSYFISAVCWKSDSPTMLTANSQGTIKVLVLAA
ncbi:hypothetical protein YC2023_049821 [Brassica napus]